MDACHQPRLAIIPGKPQIKINSRKYVGKQDKENKKCLLIFPPFLSIASKEQTTVAKEDIDENNCIGVGEAKM